MRQARIQSEGEIAATDHLIHQPAQTCGQTLAAIRRIGVERTPAALDEGLVGFLEALRSAHYTVLVMTALGIAAGVERQ